jgi:WD40 repeat protein
MGCKPGTTRVQNLKVDLKQEMTGIEKVDTLFGAPLAVLKDVEAIRKRISVRWNEILKDSGAIVIKEPTLRHVFFGAMWKISHDLPTAKNVADLIKLSGDDPYIKFSGPENLITTDVKDLMQSMKDYFMICVALKDDVEKLVKTVQDKVQEVTDILKEPQKLFEGVEISPFDLIKQISKCKTNLSKIVSGYKVIQCIASLVSGTAKTLPDLLKIMDDKEKLLDLYNKGEDARKKKLVHAPKICWEYEKEGKLDKYEDYLKLLEEDKKNKADAGGDGGDVPQAKPSGGAKPETKEEPKPKEGGGMTVAPNEPGKTSNQTNDQDLKIKLQVNEDKIKTLQKEVEDYQRKNNELQNQLNSKSKSDNNVAVVKRESFPVYIFKYQALKNWILCFKKSVQTKDEQSISVIENIPDLDIIATANATGKVSLFQTNNFVFGKEFQAHSGNINSLCYMCDGETLFSGGNDGKVIKYEISKNNYTVFSEGNAPVVSINYAFDGETLYVTQGSKINAYDIRTKQVKSSFSTKGNSEFLTTHFIKSSGILLAGSKDNYLTLFNTKTGSSEYEWRTEGVVADILSVSVGGAWRFVVLENNKSDESKVWYYDIGLRKVLREQSIGTGGRKISYCQDSRTIVVANTTGTFTLLNVDNETSRSFQTRGNPFTSSLYIGGDCSLVLASADGYLDFWGCK